MFDLRIVCTLEFWTSDILPLDIWLTDVWPADFVNSEIEKNKKQKNIRKNLLKVDISSCWFFVSMKAIKKRHIHPIQLKFNPLFLLAWQVDTYFPSDPEKNKNPRVFKTHDSWTSWVQRWTFVILEKEGTYDASLILFGM